VLRPWSAAALPEIMAGALEESKRGAPVPFHEGRAAGQKPSSVAGARGSGAAEARARPNVGIQRTAKAKLLTVRWNELLAKDSRYFRKTASNERCLTSIKRRMSASWAFGEDISRKQSITFWRGSF